MSRALPILLLFFAFAAGASNASAAITVNDAWSATGPTATVTPDGTGATLKYAVAGHSGAWTMQATAGATRTVSVPWRYTGYHAYYAVEVGIERFVIRDGQEIVSETLQSAKAPRCCAAPSGGFDYSGKTAFDVKAGDVYGFRMRGSNFDRDARLNGTLRLDVGDLTPPAITPQVTGTLGENGWYRSNVTLRWSVSDPESDVYYVKCLPQWLYDDTPSDGTTYTCTVKSVGGIGTASVTIKRDTTPPVAVIYGRHTTDAWGIYSFDGQRESEYTIAPKDYASGLALTPTTCMVLGTYPMPLTSSILMHRGPGTCRFVDNAGNETTKTFRVL